MHISLDYSIILLLKHSFATSVSKTSFFLLSRKMACSQQEFSTYTTTADLGRGDCVRRWQSGGGCAGERGPTGAQRGRMRYRLPEETETGTAKLSMVAAKHSE